MSIVARLLEGVSEVRAVLGPTNTGKTHRAIERMLEHPSGMIGLPLRLLAREVYDRVAAAKGPDQVALVTGEEKRIPAKPRYFVCTVEAMPLDRPVAFVAVDEVQLAGDRTRGHVFTDRILRARGMLETMLLGSDTAAPILERLVRGLRIERQPRLSTLTFAGDARLGALPKRSAVVAFSVERVYALAERLRARHGGVAVVHGALSPRTRNAQVAMFQAGEVPYLVATDAIGMGLNLDLDHVAFTELSKYDGMGRRDLSAAEIAQIAGRAGRFRRDGTFGTTADLEELDPEVIEAVETHRFPVLETVFWRSADLDLGSVEGLLASLSARSPAPWMVRMRSAEDHEALEALAGRPEVSSRAVGAERVALLWDVCQVPDFLKTLTDSHAELLAAVYGQIVDAGALDDDWVARRIERLDRSDGDLDALTTRIASVRTWSFLAHRRGWMRDAATWQERTRAIEDRLSDALHEELTRRFVDRRAMAAQRAGRAGEGLVEGDVVAVDGARVGALTGLSFRPDAEARTDRPLLKAVRAAIAPELARRVEALAGDGDEAFSVDPDGVLRWRGAPIGRWTRGTERAAPRVRLLANDALHGTDRERVLRRLEKWTQARIDALLAPTREGRDRSPALRAVLHAVRAGLGGAPREALEADVRRLGEPDRQLLARRSIRLGVRAIYAADALAPAQVAVRVALTAVHDGIPAPPPPSPGATSLRAQKGVPDAFYAAIGFPRLGPLAVRVDMAERVAAQARRLAREGSFAPPAEWLSWLGCSREDLSGVLAGLDFRLLGDDPPRYGFPPRAEKPRRGRRPADWG